MTKVSLLVSVDEEHLSRFSEVARGVEAAGMEVDQRLEDVGVLTGSLDSSRVESLRQVEGVSHVEESGEVQVPPPDSEVQ